MSYHRLAASGLDYLLVGSGGEVQAHSPGIRALLGLVPTVELTAKTLANLPDSTVTLDLRDGTTLHLFPASTADGDIATLRRQNRTLRDTLNAIDATVVVYDRDRRYLMGNRAYHAMFPHLGTEEELIGQRYENLLAQSIQAGTVADPEAYRDAPGFIARRIQEISESGTYPREIYSRASDRWFMIRVNRTPDGSRVALRVDITQQKRLQAELAAAHHAAEAANRSKSQFLANVSHELRTPLNAIINFARLMAEAVHGPLGDPRYVEYAETIRGSGEYLSALFNDLLDLARAEAGRLALSRQLVDVAALVPTACRMLAPEAQEAGITMRTDLPELPPVPGDAIRLRQVLVNLISNAIKFSAPGSEVHIAVRATDGWIEASVTDTGYGIAASDLDRILLPFEQVLDPSRPRNPGVGLGLPLAKHLVELHGGTLTLDSMPDQGTTATVRLPMSGTPAGADPA